MVCRLVMTGNTEQVVSVLNLILLALLSSFISSGVTGMLRAAAQGYYLTCTTGRDLTCCFIPNKDMIITFSVEKEASSKTDMHLVISCC